MVSSTTVPRLTFAPQATYFAPMPQKHAQVPHHSNVTTTPASHPQPRSAVMQTSSGVLTRKSVCLMRLTAVR
jgi:hypothetical protein